jgi:hypothetical protein
LRQTNIVRLLLKNVPIRLVASHMIPRSARFECNYSRYITEHADEHACAALLGDSPDPTKVVNRRRPAHAS